MRKEGEELFELYPKVWIVIEWFDDGEKGKSIQDVHVFSSRKGAREFKKHRADKFLDSSMHEAETGS